MVSFVTACRWQLFFVVVLLRVTVGEKWSFKFVHLTADRATVNTGGLLLKLIWQWFLHVLQVWHWTSSLVFSTNHTFVLPFFFIPHSLINADFCCAGSLIAYGALLGKVSPVQLMVVTLFGVTLFAVEEYIILSLLHVSLTKPSRTRRWFHCCLVAENCP